MEEATRLNTDLLTRDLPEADLKTPSPLSYYLPAILVIVGALAMLGLRLQIGSGFISDGAFMMLALAAYILAALFQLTNLYAPSGMSLKIGYWGAVLGVFFNLSSWLVRWVNGYEHEIAQLRAAGNPETPWLFRYISPATLRGFLQGPRQSPDKDP